MRHNLSVWKCFVRIKVSGTAGWTFRSESVTQKVTQMVLNEFKQFLSHALPTSEPSSHIQSAEREEGDGWHAKGACDDVADAFLYSDCCADVVALRSRRSSAEMTMMISRDKQLHSSVLSASISSPSMNTDSLCMEWRSRRRESFEHFRAFAFDTPCSIIRPDPRWRQLQGV